MNECVRSITDEEFESEVLQHDGAVVVDFYSPHCPPCHRMSPVLDSICAERHDLKLVKLNIADHPLVAQTLGFQYVPHFILYFLGQPVAEFHGERSKDNFARWVDDNLARVK